jgi:hypothetical protein
MTQPVGIGLCAIVLARLEDDHPDRVSRVNSVWREDRCRALLLMHKL